MSESSHRIPRITAAIAYHQASAGLGETLDSVRDVFAETLVVHLDEARGTLAAGVRSLDGQDALDPARTRNLAMDAATGEWILWLEAGERLTSETAVAINAWLHTPEALDFGAAYELWIETPPVSPEFCAEQVARPRLIPRARGIQFQGIVDETLEPSLLHLDLPVRHTSWRILEGAHVHTSAYRKGLAERQARLANHEIQPRGMSARALVASAAAQALLGDRVKGTQHYYQALRLADRGSVEMLVAYYGLLATFGDGEQDRRQQLAVCLEALETYPLDAQLLSAMGTYLQQQNHIELACRSFQAAVEIGQVEPRAPYMCETQPLAASSWSLLLQLRGDLDGALRVLTDACEKFSASRRLRRARLELLVQLGRDGDALRLAEDVAEPGEAIEPLRIGLRGACLAAQGNWIPALSYLRTAFDAECREPICLRWFTVGLLGLGQTDAARSVLQAWRVVSPHDQEALRYALEIGLTDAVPAAHAEKKRSLRVDRPKAPLAHAETSHGVVTPSTTH
jgi:tetratricopeptide (TPR) repeat protein